MLSSYMLFVTVLSKLHVPYMLRDFLGAFIVLKHSVYLGVGLKSQSLTSALTSSVHCRAL